MKEIIHNSDNVLEEEINEIVVRCKALVLNGNELLLANENDVLQFPGGHLEEGETLDECLRREVLEETGIELDDDEIGNCFLKVVFMNRDWPTKGNNRKCEIYYYIIKTNKVVDSSKINLTAEEIRKNFKIDSVLLEDAVSYIKANIPKNKKNEVISPDMISAINEYISQVD